MHLGWKFFCALAVLIIAAAWGMPARAETVTNKYFSLNLPAGWKASPVQEEELFGGVKFECDNAESFMEVSWAQGIFRKKALEVFVDKLKEDHVEFSTPVLKYGVYEVSFTHPEMGKGIFLSGATAMGLPLSYSPARILRRLKNCSGL